MSFDDARAVARRAAERASKTLGEALWLREYPAEVDGDVGRVVIGVAREAAMSGGDVDSEIETGTGTGTGTGEHRAIAVVSDLGSMRSAIVEGAIDGGRIEGRSLSNVDAIDGFGDAIATAIRARAERWPLGVIDATTAIFDGLRMRLGVMGSRWRVTTWGEWTPDRPSGMAVELAGDHEWPAMIAISGRSGGGVTVVVPPAAMDTPPRERSLDAPAALAEVLAVIVEETRAAVDGRATFRARPDGLPSVIGRLAEALTGAGLVGVRSTWNDRFPSGWPTGTIYHRDDHGDHACATLTESIDGIVVRVGRATLIGDAIAGDGLAAAMRADDARLSVRTIRRRASFDVIAPFGHLAAGDRIQLLDVEYHPRDGGAEYVFDKIRLHDVDPTDADILSRLDEFLRQIG
jgi:hypothetical protein